MPPETVKPRWFFGPLLFLAYRQLFGNRRITLLMLAAVAAAVGFQVPIAATLDGYHAALMSEGVEHGTGAVRITANSQWIEGGRDIARDIARYPEVVDVLPLTTLPGVVRAGGNSMQCAVRGIRTGASSFYRLHAGTHLQHDDPTGALVGMSFAEEMGIEIGDRISLRVLLDTNPALLDEDMIGRYTVTVRGIVTGAFGGRDSVFVDGAFLAEQTGRASEATDIAVYLHDPNEAAQVKARIAATYPRTRVQTWHEYSDYLRANLAAIDAIAAIALAMVIAAVAIPVLALLYINVLHRKRDVGLLAALGFARLEVFAAFVLHAAMIAIVGISIGSCLAWVLLIWFDVHPIFEWEGFVIRPIPSTVTFLRPAAIVFGTTLLAAALPATLAARSDPARVLRGVE